MKTPLPLALAAALLATTALANEDSGTYDVEETPGSAMHENHMDAGTAGKDGSTNMDRKMEEEVQDDWREDAKERRDAEVEPPIGG
ncbi:hypothetical protein HKW98_04855 [Stutzerimonas urumqiensis]|uniref:hypothetical protein n=1 Tax=Stutzerimonas urumqiensis TaxID=638269 RepID=UPI003BAC80BD